MKKNWVSYKAYFEKCRKCASIVECMRNGKRCLNYEKNTNKACQ